MVEVSVIIPAHNRATTINAAVNSALAQTFSNLEIVIVDDASTDDTVRVIEAIGDPRIRLLRHEKNGGASAARNTGIAAARGKYIAFLDSDDEWFPDKLAVQLPALQAREPECLVSCTGVVLNLIDRNIRTDFELSDSDDWRARMAVGCDQRPGSTLLTRRVIFDEVGPLDTKLARFEDWDWMLRYVMTGRPVCIVSQPLAQINNIRGRVGQQTEESGDRFIAKHSEFYAGLPKALRKEALCDLWLQIATTYALEGRFSDSMRMAVRAIQERPLHALVRLSKYAWEYVVLKLRERA